MIATLILATTLITAEPTAPSPVVSEDIPVPGGLADMSRALEIEPVDPAMAVAELTRIVFEREKSPLLLNYLDSVARARIAAGGSAIDVVPMPLTTAIWSQAVFRRPIGRDELLAAVLSDKSAAYLAHGLTAFDDETLAYFAARPALLRSLYERDASTLAGFAAHIRIRHNRAVTPGGDAATALWEAVVGERVSDAEGFIRALLTKHGGRLAYLYDVIGYLDPPRQAFTLGLWIESASVRVQRFEKLAAVIAQAFSPWHASRTPFSRPQDDLLTLLARMQVEPSGAPSLAPRSFWAAVFAEAGAREQVGVIDAAWLAETLLTEGFRARSIALDQLGFGQRLIAGADASALSDAIYAIRALPNFRMLMLTLERIGIRPPAIYAAMARHAERVAALPVERQRRAIAQFQGAIAVTARMKLVGAIDLATAETLLRSLAGLPVDPVSGYRGTVGTWLQDRLLPAVRQRSDQSARDALLDALAGTPSPNPPRLVAWEGQEYALDLVASERARIARALDRHPDASIDAALDLHRSAHGGAKASLVAAPAPERVDAALAEALLVIAYAVDWNDPQGLGRVIRGTVAPRHDFGFTKRSPEMRARTPWAQPLQVFTPGRPWHLEGSILGLDLVLARLALRRVHADALLTAPTINEVDRETFIASLGMMNAFALQDSVADDIAGAIARGRSRVVSLGESDGASGEITGAIRMDGRRVRAVRWTLSHDPSRVAGLFSMAELFYLGGGSGSDVDSWGMSAVALLGCICSRVVPPGFHSALIGRPQLGIVSSAVADLHLRIVVALRELELPAALTKTVVAGALREFLDRVRPAHHDDWLTMVRAAHMLSIERIEDYVAAATADGPLRPVNSLQRNPRQ